MNMSIPLAKKKSRPTPRNKEREQLTLGIPLTQGQQEMVEQWSGLPAEIAARRAEPGAEIDDRIHAGHMGLIRAAQLFDPARGVQFQTYAYSWVLSKIIRQELRETKDRRQAKSVQDIDEVASTLVVRSSDIDEEKVRMAIESLEPRLRDLVFCRIWEGDTFKEAGNKIGVSKSRAKQLEERAFAELRVKLSEFSGIAV